MLEKGRKDLEVTKTVQQIPQQGISDSQLVSWSDAADSSFLEQEAAGKSSYKAAAPLLNI